MQVYHMTHVTYFFRKPRPDFHSIEGLFDIIRNHLPNGFTSEAVYAPATGANLKSFKTNLLWAKKNAGSVNHITGDINYVGMGLPYKKTVLTIHDVESISHPNLLKRFLIQKLWLNIPLKYVGAVTVISEATKQKVLNETGIDEKKVWVIPNCIDPCFVQTHKPFNDIKPRILQIGTKENKNLTRVIPALAGIKCHLRVVGKLTEKQQQLLTKHNIEYSNVFNLDQGQVIEEYQKADLLIFASTFEGFGMPILEAQATGRPVISSKCSSMPEVAGRGALLVDPYQVFDIQEAVKKILFDHELRHNLVSSGYNNVKRYKPESIAKLYAELYKRIDQG